MPSPIPDLTTSDGCRRSAATLNRIASEIRRGVALAHGPELEAAVRETEAHLEDVTARLSGVVSPDVARRAVAQAAAGALEDALELEGLAAYLRGRASALEDAELERRETWRGRSDGLTPHLACATCRGTGRIVFDASAAIGYPRDPVSCKDCQGNGWRS